MSGQSKVLYLSVTHTQSVVGTTESVYIILYLIFEIFLFPMKKPGGQVQGRVDYIATDFKYKISSPWVLWIAESIFT